MLILPAIHLRNGVCTDPIRMGNDAASRYSGEPVAVAKLWRSENFKALHLVDVQAALAGRMENFDCLRRIIESVDIPVQYSGGVRREQDLHRLFSLGVSRVVLYSLPLVDPVGFARFVETFGPRKIIAGVEIAEGGILSHGRKQMHAVESDSYFRRLESDGIERAVLFLRPSPASMDAIMPVLLPVLETTGLKITLYGGVHSYQDLKRVQGFMPERLDSVILDFCLYDNSFPCQQIWRHAEKKLIRQGVIRAI